MMDDALRAQIESYKTRLDMLVHRGRDIRDALLSAPADAAALAAARRWQQDCGVTINELSGSSKAHWLARAFSEAFLVRASAGPAVQEVQPAEIVNRLLAVVEQALASLARDDAPALIAAAQQPPPRRFDFVHNVELRPVLEQAHNDGRDALEAGNYELALLSYCGVLEAIVTDALQNKALSGLPAEKVPEGNISDWSFDTRLSVAEQAGLIGRGCARLPAAARSYRDNADASTERPTVSERDARLTAQVLHVVMRDLNPGR